MPLTIFGSVGTGGVNAPNDVRNVQILLNCSHLILGNPSTRLNVDGNNGPLTEAAIRSFQSGVVMGVVDGRVDPGGAAFTRLNLVAATLDLGVVQSGDPTKVNPYTIAIVSNPALENPRGSGAFIPDPIQVNPLGFAAAVTYTTDALFGRQLGQKENLLADAAIGPKIKIVRVFLAGIPASDSTALVAQFAPQDLEPRRAKFKDYLACFGVVADVAYAITGSLTHTRAAAWFTTDDPARGTVPYELDGTIRSTSLFCSIPGTVAQHVTTDNLTGLHEFGHAFSSFTEGAIVDQYNDSAPDINVKHGRPIPASFGTFESIMHASDPVRDGLGYEPTWTSYHPALTDPGVPSLMDNYWKAALPRLPIECRFDTLTAAYIRSRFVAKLSRL